MMKMTTMKKLVDTLNKNYESSIANEIASYWGYDKGSVKEQRISANAVFRFKKSGEDHFLRFNSPSERTFEYIKAEVDFLNYLSDSDISVAKPVKSLSGNYIEKVDTSLDTYYAVVFTALKGKQYDIENLNKSMFHTWGRALGMLHHASIGYETKHRPSWKNHLKVISEILPKEEILVQKELRFVTNKLTKLSMSKMNYGLIHHDFELDNLFWNGNHISILDFDDCDYYWYVADIAFALRDLFVDVVDFNNENYLSFIEGYQTKMSIDKEVLKDLPLFRRMADLVTYAKLLRAFEGSSPEGDEEWVRLWNKIESHIDEHRKHFEEYHR
ncbi:MAG: phosphotransferase [bacterium]